MLKAVSRIAASRPAGVVGLQCGLCWRGLLHNQVIQLAHFPVFCKRLATSEKVSMGRRKGMGRGRGMTVAVMAVAAAATILVASPASAAHSFPAFTPCHAGSGFPVARGRLCFRPNTASAFLPTPSLCPGAAATATATVVDWGRQRGVACRGISMSLSTQPREEGEVGGTQVTTKMKRGSRTFSRQTFTMTDEEAMEAEAQRFAKSAEMSQRYDPEEAERVYSMRTLDVWRRDMEISVPFTAFLGKVLIDFERGVEEQNRPQRAKEFMNIIASLGPAFIKAGQALSSRPDLLPPEYLAELQKLQDRLPPFPNERAFAIIESELGMKMNDVFEKVDPVPVAAASIGQVYKAYLKNGEPVAIKVQRPECEGIIAMDIYILRQLSGALSQLIKLLRRDIDLQSVFEEFGRLIYEEIDYLNEARNAERFAELYSSVLDVKVPRIYWRFSRRRVLTMEWIDGVRITSKSLSGERKSKMVQAMVQCSLRQMLEKGFFHADPHGGNLLATPDGRLAYLDFGMMSEVEPFQRYGILEAVVHMVNRDFKSLCELYVRLGFIPPGTDITPIENALQDALPDVLGASVEEFNFKSVISKLGDIMYKFPFSLPPYYTAIVRTLGVLEGLALEADGSFRIINNAYPYIASRVLTDPQLQKPLQLMVFSQDGRVRWTRLEDLIQNAAGTDDWDVEQAGKLFSEFLLKGDNKNVRSLLATDVLNLVDSVGLETYHYATKASQAQLASLLPPQLKSSLPPPPLSDSQHAPEVPERLKQVFGLAEALSGSAATQRVVSDPGALIRAGQGVVQTEEGRELIINTAAMLGERAVSRGIRLLFGLPQPKPEEYPSDRK